MDRSGDAGTGDGTVGGLEGAQTATSESYVVEWQLCPPPTVVQVKIYYRMGLASELVRRRP